MENLWMKIPFKYVLNEIKLTYWDGSACVAILNDGYGEGEGRTVIREETVEELTRALGTVQKVYEPEEEPDFVAGNPNYNKYIGWSPERTLRFLNID